MEIRRSWSALRTLSDRLCTIIPGACLLCEQACTGQYSLCQYCEADLPFMTSRCRVCGEAHPASALHEQCCGRCRSSPPVIDGCLAAFHYAAPVDRLILDFKHHALFSAGHALGAIMARRLGDHLRDHAAPQLLLPVPLHIGRLRRRGYNQAWELCKLLSRSLRIPGSADVLVKTRATTPQSEQTAAARRRTNLRGVFALRENRCVKNVNHIAIIDDVVTTMSTVNELGRVLKSHGIRRVEAWCLARASR